MKKQQKDSKKYHDIRRMFGRRQLFVSILIMLALAVTGVTVILVLSRAERIAVEEPVYQYVFSEQERFADGISMKKNTDGIIVDNGYQQYETNGYPFYYENEKAMILTDSFIHMAADATTDGRVDYFTTITETEGGYTLSNPKDTVLKDGMLYDGDDVYIFLEETTVTTNGVTRAIPALSYVVCFQGQSILIGYYGADEAIYEDLDENGATATMANGIKVDLVNDIYYRQNGTKHLLFASAEMFDKVQ